MISYEYFFVLLNGLDESYYNIKMIKWSKFDLKKLTVDSKIFENLFIQKIVFSIEIF